MSTRGSRIRYAAVVAAWAAGVSTAIAGTAPRDLIAFHMNAIDGKTIQLIGNDRKTTYTFQIDEKTIFCMGDRRVSDGSYMKAHIGKETYVSIKLTPDHKKAAVVWDLSPARSGWMKDVSWDYPPMCK